MSQNNLHRLYADHGQSPWLDNLRRDWIESGELQDWIDKGCRGITSNPTIFAQAMSQLGAYDAQLFELKDETSLEHIYWQLVLKDIAAALEMLKPIYEESNGLDGFVSVEVSPLLADDHKATVAAAQELTGLLPNPNLYIKVPATDAGITSIEKLVGQGINVNVTLIFSLERYQEVIQAYLSGLNTLAKQDSSKLSKLHSVASFFVSRVDSEVDKQLTDIGSKEALDMCGKAAVAQAQAAYQIFLKEFATSEFEELAKQGANFQRPLWASVSTKNPDYLDTLYVDTLIGPNTVSTMPDNTLSSFLDHGKLESSISADVKQHVEVLNTLAELGIDMLEVGKKLESEGVKAFAKSYTDALTILENQRDAINIA